MKSNFLFQAGPGCFLTRFVLPGCLFVCALPAGLLAQTVAFTGTSTLGSGFNDLRGVAVDGNGNVYVADTGNNAVKEILAVGGSIPASPTIETLGSGLVAPYGVAVDGSGNVYVADSAQSAVYEMLAVDGSVPASPTIRTLGSGFKYPWGLAVDGSGNVYVGDYGNHEVYEMLAVGGSIPATPVTKTLGSGYSYPTGVALEPVINFAPVNPMESARLSQSDWDSGGNSECIPCHISRAPRFTRVLSIRATHAAPQS